MFQCKFCEKLLIPDEEDFFEIEGKFLCNLCAKQITVVCFSQIVLNYGED